MWHCNITSSKILKILWRGVSNMLDLNDIYYFVTVVDRAGISAASRVLGIPKSTVSHRIQELEASLGVRLLNRSSRQFSVSDAGREFYERAARIVQEAREAEALLRERVTEPVGTMRITTATATAQFAIAKIIPAFLQKYPKITIIQHVTNAAVDLIAENFDLAIRGHSGELPDSNLISRTIGHATWRLFAAGRYLSERGTPLQPADLQDHNLLSWLGSSTWQLTSPEGTTYPVTPEPPRLLSDDLVALKASAERGLGIVVLPAYMCHDQVRSGELQTILPEWSAGESTMTALVPSRQGILPSVRALLDFLAAEMPAVLAGA